MMVSNFVENVCRWNIERDNLNYSRSLEYSMLDEEVNEFLVAGLADDEVAMADALADTAVVAIGGLIKLCKGDLEKVDDILLAVTAANDTKSNTKNEQGKITKPEWFIGPEEMIGKILNGG